MSDPPRRIAVTGASGYIGTALVRRLEAEPHIEHVLAIDVRAPARAWGPKVAFLPRDISTPDGSLLSQKKIDALVHLAYLLRPSRDREAGRRINVGGTVNVLDACVAAGVRKILYLSSTSVYGGHRDNPALLTEDHPARPTTGFQYSEDKAASEAIIRRYRERVPDAETTVLRACPVMGPNADNFVSRAFLKPFLVAVRGYDPPMQLLHKDDLTDLVVHCLLNDAPGLYNAAGEGTILWSEMVDILGRRLVTLPAPLLYFATEASWKLRLQSTSPASGLDFVRYPWTASTEKIRRQLGVSFRYTSREAWEAFARAQ